MKVEIPFIGGAYTGHSKKINSQICQNLFVEIDKEAGQSQFSLVGTPGLKLWTSIAGAGDIRPGGMKKMKDDLYVVAGKTVYKITKLKTATSLGTISTSSGKVWMATDGTYMVIVDGVSSAIWYITGGTLTELASTGVAASLDYQDGRWIITEKDTREFYISDADDPTTWSSLNFATAEGAGDDLVGLNSSNRLLRLFGKESLELWYWSGETFPFSRNPGGFLEIGCATADSIAEIEGVVLWMDDKFRIVMTSNLNYIPVSTYQINYQISQMTNKTDVLSYAYNQGEHSYYVISFLSDNKTFCFDISTGYWHTRATGQNDLLHPVSAYVPFDDKVLVGDRGVGKIYEYDLNTYTDNGIVVRAIRSAQAVITNEDKLYVHEFGVDFDTGVGIATGQGSDPKVMLEYSWDGGYTFSNEIWESMGKIGAYDTRVKFHRLGSGRRGFVPKLTISDPVKRVITNAYIEAERGYH